MAPDGNVEPARLSSWKEIAVYLDTSVRTAQRWEALEGLPVHRNEHSKSARVYALESELNAWRESRRARVARENGRLPPAWVWLSIALALCAVVAGTALWRETTKEAPTVVHLTTVPGVKFAPAFSPDGAQVSFAWDGGVPGRSDIYAKSVGAGEPRRLTTS